MKKNKKQRAADKLKRGVLADARHKDVLKKFAVRNPKKHAVVDPLFERVHKKVFVHLMEALVAEGYRVSFARATDKSKGGKYKDFLSRKVMDKKNTKGADLLVTWGLPTRWALEKEFSINVLSFVYGFFPDTWICDSKGYWGDSMISKSIAQRVEECMSKKHIAWASDYSKKMIKSNKSKRKQPSKSPNVEGKFIFLPTQDIADASVRLYSNMTYVEFIKQVVDFCCDSKVKLVVKRHPTLLEKPKSNQRTWRVSQNRKLNKVFKYAKGKLKSNFVEVDGSVHFYCGKCTCMVGLNPATVVDGCMNNCVISQHAESVFMNSGAVVHNKNVHDGLSKALSLSSKEIEIMKKKQMALLYYLHHRYLITTSGVKREMSNKDKIRSALKVLE